MPHSPMSLLLKDELPNVNLNKKRSSTTLSSDGFEEGRAASDGAMFSRVLKPSFSLDYYYIVHTIDGNANLGNKNLDSVILCEPRQNVSVGLNGAWRMW